METLLCHSGGERTAAPREADPFTRSTRPRGSGGYGSSVFFKFPKIRIRQFPEPQKTITNSTKSNRIRQKNPEFG